MSMPTLLCSALALSLSLAVNAAVVPDGTTLAKKQYVVINNGAEIQSFDPHRSEGVPESEVAMQLFEGLTSYDADGNVIPGVAERWESSPDYKTWTFHLRQNAKWSDGRPVTANDFVYAWRRLVTPATASPNASFLEYLQVENVTDVINGKQKPNALGVEALDDFTFVVHLQNPVPYAVSLTAHQALLPVPKHVIEQFGDYWVRPAHIVGNGAYQLKNHILNEKIEFERNPFYWDNAHTVIDGATFLAIENASTDVARYRAGDLDITASSVPPEQFAKLKKEFPNELFTTKTLATYSYEFNLEKPPFNDIRVRKALNLALDRHIITDKVLGMGQQPTYVLTPTYINEGGAIKQPIYSQLPMNERNAQAVQLLEAAGFSKANPLKFSVLYNTGESHKKIAIAVASLWKANTKGLVDVKLENQEWKTYLETRRKGNYQVARAGWLADYDQATTFLNIYLSHSSNNKPRYRNAEFDRVIADSYALDKAGREAAYAKAEQILADDFAFLPMYTYVSPRLVKPYVKGYQARDPQNHILLRNLYVVSH